MADKEYIEREANCKDCICYDVCFVVRHNGDDRVLRNSPCKHFRNKADVVEVAILRACKKQQMDEIKFLSASRLSMWDELNAHRIGYDKGVKEFAARFKESLLIHEGDFAIIEPADIDNLVKEMVGDSDA